MLGRLYQSVRVRTNGRPVVQYAYIVAGMFCMLLCSGLVFGWSSLLLVLQAEGVYSELCPSNATTIEPVSATSFSFRTYLSSSSNTTVPEKMCAKQSLRFELVFICGLATVFFSTPLSGYILDSFGPRFLGHVASSLVALGALMLAFGYHTTKLDLLIPGLIAIAFGGMATLLAVFPFARIKPQYTSIILAFYNVSFDSSPVVLYIYVKLYQRFGLSPRTFFLIYLIAPLSMLLLSFFWPSDIDESPEGAEGQKTANKEINGKAELDLGLDETETDSNENSTSSKAVNGHSKTANGHSKHDMVELDIEMETCNNSGEEKDLHTVALEEEHSNGIENAVAEPVTSELGPVEQFSWTFKQQLLSFESLLICILHLIFSPWMSAYMGSVQLRLKAIEPNGNLERVDQYTEHFGLVLSLAFIAAPLVAISIHTFKVLKALFLCIALSIVWNLALFLPFSAQIFTFIIFAIVRAWYYGIIFTFITHTFSWTNLGKLWGAYNGASGFISFAFYGLSWAVVHLLGGSYLIPNIVSTISFASTLLIAFYFKRRHDKFIHDSETKKSALPPSLAEH